MDNTRHLCLTFTTFCGHIAPPHSEKNGESRRITSIVFFPENSALRWGNGRRGTKPKPLLVGLGGDRLSHFVVSDNQTTSLYFYCILLDLWALVGTASLHLPVLKSTQRSSIYISVPPPSPVLSVMSLFAGIIRLLAKSVAMRPVPPVVKADLTGKTVVVVGANAGLGLEACKHFAMMKPARIIMGCRSEKRGQEALQSTFVTLQRVSTIPLTGLHRTSRRDWIYGC